MTGRLGYHSGPWRTEVHPWSNYWGSASCFCLSHLMTLCFLHCSMRCSFWRTHRPFPSQWSLHYQYHCSSLFFSLSLLAFTASRVGGPWCKLALPLLNTFCTSLMISLSCLQAFDPLELRPGYKHPWDTLWTTYLKLGGYYTSSGLLPSPVLLWTPFPYPTESSWSTCSPWSMGMMIRSRGWFSALKLLNRFLQQWRSCFSILQSVGWLRRYHVWNDTSSWFTALCWCLRILYVCQGAPILQLQRTLRIYHLGYWRCMMSWRFFTCI